MEIFMEQHPELFSKDDVRAYIDINDAEEVEVLRKDLFAKFKNKSSYGCVGRTANYWYLCDYFGESSYKIRTQIQINGNENLLNAIERDLGNGTFRDAEDFIRRVKAIAASYRQYYDGDVDVTVTKTADGDAALDGRQYKTWNNQGTSDGQSTGDNGQTISTAEDWNRDVQLLRTPSGEVYGFVYQGEIYMDETKLDPQVPIHEYTHIWDEVVMQSSPRLWERGKRLLRDSSNSVLRNLWNEIAESDAYGKKWQAQGKTEEQIENLIAGEVHARLVGEKGAELLEQIEKNTGGRGLVARLKRWMKDVFRHIGKTFGTWTDEVLNELSLNDFINMPLRDFVDGVNPNNYKYPGISSDISAEMEQIRQNAIADGTFMKAPNGKKSNLTERQWLQVRTKAFKDWFGDWENDPANASKVVDENGEPLVVYHGTLNEFTTFHEGITKWYGKTGIFFSSDKDYAESMSVYKWISKYANMWEPLRKELNPSEELYTMPVFLNIKNPAKIDSLNHRTVGKYR